jgi:uncharacterized protein YjbI with pentapeptide repeats
LEIINKTPFSFASIVGRYYFPSYSFTFVVKGTFDLKFSEPAAVSKEQFFPTGNEFYPEDEEMLGGPRYPSDFAYFKPGADILLVGKCYTPEGKKLSSCLVKFQAGSKSKSLTVYGNRFWIGGSLSNVPSNPELFSEMELRYENSFGGTEYKKNPVGKGTEKKENNSGEKLILIPNILHFDERVSSPAVKLEPAGFGPLGEMWIQRFSKLGSYKGSYLKERWPWFPKDFDWSYFNSAPYDMQLNGYLKGDEKLYLENLNRIYSKFYSRLPGIRIRTFVNELSMEGKNFREVKMNLDTLWIDTENEKMVLVWRGLSEIKTEDYEEIEYIFINSEKLEEQPASNEFYKELLQKELAEPEETVIEKPVKPESTEEIEVEKEIVKAEEEMRAALIEAGIDPDNLPQPTDEEKKKEAELLKELGFEDEAEEIKLTRELVIRRINNKENFDGEDLRSIDLSELNFRGLSFKNSILTGTSIKNSDLSKCDFSGANLSKTDLSGAKLIGAILGDADLTSANMVKSELNEAAVEGAVFENAKLNNANLNNVKGKDAIFFRADLTEANLIKSDFSGADFSKTILDKTNFTSTVLCETSVEGASGIQANFSATDLTMIKASGSNFAKSKFSKAKGLESIWEKAVLDEADFSYGEMEGANFSAASLQRANLTAANMKSVKFTKADLTDAVLRDMNLFQGSFEKANLTKADCSRSNFYGVEFLDSKISGTKFLFTNLKMTKLAGR